MPVNAAKLRIPLPSLSTTMGNSHSLAFYGNAHVIMQCSECANVLVCGFEVVATAGRRCSHSHSPSPVDMSIVRILIKLYTHAHKLI